MPGAGIRALHVLVLVAFAVAQPLLDVVARHVEFLVAHRADRIDLALLAFGLGLALPAAVALPKWALERALPRLAPPLHLAALSALCILIALPVAKRALAAPELAAAAAATAGLAAPLAYARLPAARSFATLLTPALLVFPLVFLSRPAVRPLLEPATPSAAGDADARAASDVPVVVVVFDALALNSLLDPEGGIDAARHPHFAALAAEADWYRNATTVAERTSYAVPAILTGRYPRWKRAPTAAQYPENLFALLAASHELHVIENSTLLCPEQACGESAAAAPRPARLAAMADDLAIVYLHLLLPEPWTRGLPRVDATWRDFAPRDAGDAPAGAGSDDADDRRARRRDVRSEFARFLAGFRAGERAGLHFVHLNLPHYPLKYLPSGAEYRPEGAFQMPRFGRQRVDLEWAATQALQRHLLQVAYADRLLGALSERLRETELYDRALLIVTSDHGVSYQVGVDRRAILPENVDDVLRVPLFVKRPGQREGRVLDRNAETIDILPTILDVLGQPAPEGLDGQSLLDPSLPERPRKLAYSRESEEFPLRLVRHGFGRTLPSASGTVRRIAERFDTAAGAEGLFRVGPLRDLLGRRADALPTREPGGYRVAIEDAESYRSFDPGGGFVPARIKGRLRSPELGEERLVLAIAVNGTIRATTFTFLHREDAIFEAMVPEDAFRPGANDVDVYVVEETPDGPRLIATRRG